LGASAALGFQQHPQRTLHSEFPLDLKKRPFCNIYVVVAIKLMFAAWAGCLASVATAANCAIGAYRMSDGQTVDVAPADEDTLRWRDFGGATGHLERNGDGSWTSTYGWTGRPDGNRVSFDCESGGIMLGPRRGEKVDLDITETSFQSGGVNLVGRLLMPRGSGKVAVVVLVHGSEHDSALDFNPLQRIFPAHGIGAFVYDKRGTGASGGRYTQDFSVLADDAIAAMKEARRLARTRISRIGYQGGSQAGWVLPLAANRAPVDFSIVGFGLAVTVLEEDRESVALDMAFHHRSPAEAKKALELASAGERLVASGGTQGYEEFDALRKKYIHEPWYSDVHGDFLFFILPLAQAQIIEGVAKTFVDTPFRYDPMVTLRASTTPQLWILGTDDLEAPSQETGRRIRALMSTGKDYTLAIYPRAEHGMTEYEVAPDGTRNSTRYVTAYFEMLCDFARYGRIQGPYGEASIWQAKRN
jgi:uncharacterized protein